MYERTEGQNYTPYDGDAKVHLTTMDLDYVNRLDQSDDSLPVVFRPSNDTCISRRGKPPSYPGH